MSCQIRFSPDARRDLFESIDWLNQQQNGLGWQFADELDIELQKIAADPFRFPPVDHTARRRKAILITRFAFTIYFSIGDREIAIAAVFHPKRNPELLKQRGIT